MSSRLESFGLSSLRQGSSSSYGNLNLSAKNEAASSRTALQNAHDIPSTSKASPPPAEPETTSSPSAPSTSSRKRAQSGNNSTSGVSTTPDSFRKRKLAFSRDSPSKLPDAKKPLLEQIADEQEQTRSNIPRLKL